MSVSIQGVVEDKLVQHLGENNYRETTQYFPNMLLIILMPQMENTTRIKNELSVPRNQKHPQKQNPSIPGFYIKRWVDS